MTWRRLGEAGLISREPGRERWRVRRRVAGATRTVIELDATLLRPTADGATAPRLDHLEADLGRGDVLDGLDAQFELNRYRPEDPRRFTR